MGAAARILVTAVVLGGLALACGGASAWGTRHYHYSVSPPGQSAVRLFVEEQGQGKPIVLLHGLGASTYAWRKVAPLLAEDHRVIAIDMKGFGRSSKPLDERYAARDHARLIAGFMAGRGLEDVTLVGHSFGGTVALALLLAEQPSSSRVGRVVLIDAPAYPQRWPITVDLLSDPTTAEAALRVVPPEVTVKLSFAGALKVRSAINDDDIRTYARPLYDEGAPYALVQTLRGLLDTDFAAAARSYGRITQPALVVWCRDDPIVPLQTGILLSRAMPNATLKIDDDCGHVPLEETPGRLARWIHDFVAHDVAASR